MARVPYLSPEDATPDTAGVWQRLEAERKLPTANIFRALANAPALLDASLSYANALRNETELDPKLRELAILTVGHAAQAEYEIAHHQAHAVRAGVTAEQLANITNFETSDVFDYLGVCFHTDEQGPSTWGAAAQACANSGGRLPTASELADVPTGRLPFTNPEWTGDLGDATDAISATGNGGFNEDPGSTANHFRCVLQPTN
jgi:AhpD family alkylhydroperoxidase